MKCLPAAYELPFAGSKINGKDRISSFLFWNVFRCDKTIVFSLGNYSVSPDQMNFITGTSSWVFSW